VLGVTQKNLAGRGGADPLVGAHEDGGAKLRLELAQELAQAGLRDVQPLGGFRDALLFGKGVQIV